MTTNLASRCPACGTVFRVALAQLRESDGWVRCGRCNGVFNAAEVMFDIDSGMPVHLDGPPEPQPPDATPDSTPDATPASAPADPDDEAAPSITDWPAPVTPPAPMPSPAAAPLAAPGRQEPRFDSGPPWPLPAGASLAQREEPLLRAPSARPEDATGHAEPAWPALADPAPANGTPPAFNGQASVPSFMRAAEQAALWRQPAVRTALAAAVLLLGLALAAQAAVLWRDALAAHLPATEPGLRALCRLAGCQVLPLRQLDALAVDSSGLNQLDGSTLYRLQLVLRNRADTAVMMPALDLSLSDGQGKLVTRRVVQMADLGATQASLQAGLALPIKVLLSAGEQRIDGYTVELFYP